MHLAGNGSCFLLPQERDTLYCHTALLDCTKAFDKCRFDILFKKLVDRNVPAVVTRVLMLVYEEQQAWVKWGKSRSRTFGIVNGTRQGSVLSPALFSVYMDNLIVKLRNSRVGCSLVGSSVVWLATRMTCC